MSVYLAKEVNSQIPDMAFKNVQALKIFVKEIKSNHFDHSQVHEIDIKDRKCKKARLGDSLEIYFYEKEDSTFILSVVEKR